MTWPPDLPASPEIRKEKTSAGNRLKILVILRLFVFIN
jgi:hypothetical protein